MNKIYKTFILSILTICLESNDLNADDTNTRPLWGVKAAIDLNIPGKWHGKETSFVMYRHGFGGTIGCVYNVYLGKDFYLEPGASLFYDTYSFKGMVINGDKGERQNDPSVYKFGLRIPLVVGYSFNIVNKVPLSVYTGPEISYAFIGGTNFKYKHLDYGEISHLFGKKGYQRRTDCAWKLGVAFDTDPWSITLDYSFGLTDLIKTGIKFRENRLTLGLTRYF